MHIYIYVYKYILNKARIFSVINLFLLQRSKNIFVRNLKPLQQLCQKKNESF
jgi:hypothetical protein